MQKERGAREKRDKEASLGVNSPKPRVCRETETEGSQREEALPGSGKMVINAAVVFFFSTSPFLPTPRRKSTSQVNQFRGNKMELNSVRCVFFFSLM